MDAPLPRRIHLDVSPAAAASLGHGLRHVLAREPVLKIGLPLVAGLDLRQLSGVLAHELGHFRQGWAMRLWLLAGHITHWLDRSAYKRDRWDERLEQLGKDAFPLVCCAAWAVQALVWCTRQVFRLLLRLAVALSASMSRQMEYDADRCEAQLAGSDSLEGTLRRSTELDLAWNIVLDELPVRFRERRLPDDLPAFVAAMATRLPAPAVAQVESIMTERSTGLLACHPSIPRPIEAVRRLGEPGGARRGARGTGRSGDQDGAAGDWVR